MCLAGSIFAATAACGDSGGGPTAGTASTGSGACTSTKGTIVGKLTLAGSDMPAQMGIVLVRMADNDTPLQGKAQPNGEYSINVDAGSWLVGGKDGDYCETLAETKVEVTACNKTTADLKLDCVFGAGGAGGGK